MVVTLLYCVAGGMLGVLGTSRVEQIAWKFIRLVGLLTLAMATIATAILWQERSVAGNNQITVIISAGVALFAGSTVLFLIAPMVGRFGLTIRWVSFLGGVAGVAASSMTFLRNLEHVDVLSRVLLVAGQVFSAWLLGAITLAWLLGHAYLTATKMTIAPLRYLSSSLSSAVIARIGFVGICLLLAWFMESGSPVWPGLGRWWIIAVLRFGVGLGLVAVMAYMVSDCVRLRSTQSATGILYFASLMAYVGELASQYLTRELGWPI